MHKYFLFLTLFFLILNSCTGDEEKPVRPNYTSDEVKEIIHRAIKGDGYSNHLLSRLIDLSLPANTLYKELSVEEVILNGKQCYAVLLIYNNPVYNRFAVYDRTLKLFLIDKSLNGTFSTEYFTLEKNDIIKITELFLSKDIVSLERLSFYSFHGGNLKLIFRTFTRYQKDQMIMLQSIVHQSMDSIMTSINAPRNIRKDIYYDVFHFNDSMKKFAGTKNYFNNFVIEELKKQKHKTELYQIKDKASGIESTGMEAHKDTAYLYSNYKNRHFRFTLVLTDGWQINDRVMITNQLSDKMEGTVFTNDDLGGKISVIRLPEGTDASYFINYPLVNQKESYYTLRYSSRIEIENSYYFFFEVICGINNYLIILESTKSNYENHKNIYLSIINSFGMEC